MQTRASAPQVLQSRPSLDASRSSGDQSARETAESAVKSFSIVVGGPVYDLLHRFHLVRQTLPNVWRRIVALLVIIWLPLLLLSLKEGMAFGHQVRIPFLYDLAMYGRFFLGLPLVLYAELWIDPAVRQAVSEFVDARLVPDQELPEFENVLRRVQQMRDSWIPEVILLILAFFPLYLFHHEWVIGVVTNWHTTAKGLSAAGWWYLVFSAPVMRYIVCRWVFRYLLWAVLLWQISRLQLTLMPTHPDRAAGLNFLTMTQKHFGILACALGCSVAGRVGNTMLFEGASLGSFKSSLVGFVVLSVIVGLLPLALWIPKLKKVRKAGLLEYGRFAKTYTESFDGKWIHCTARAPEPMLGTADLQSLADLGNSFSFIERMRMAPISRKLIQQLAGWTAIPLVPVIILGTPTAELVHEVIKLIS
jgi:hypothetical protein